MLIVITVAGALFAHNAFALIVGRSSTPQAVLSADDDGRLALPAGFWKDVDISEGWADPRINGGRLLDVSRIPVSP
jgi:hypothetical protein